MPYLTASFTCINLYKTNMVDWTLSVSLKHQRDQREPDLCLAFFLIPPKVTFYWVKSNFWAASNKKAM